MEFRYDIDKLLPEVITVVDNSLVVKGWQSSTRNRMEYQQLYDVINTIGEASAFAQGLNKVITSSEKLQNSEHILYLLKEAEPDNGRIVVVGMLKIGRKKLFVLDKKSQTKEVAPLCVLDFYIHESRQRRGYGRRLFEYMLRHQNVDPGHLAVDKPSDKFLFFLKKHYGLEKHVPQINNFVVYDEFFMERPVSSQEAALTYVNRSNRSSRTASPEGSPSPGDSRRPSGSGGFAGKPSRCRESTMSDILHGKTERCHTGLRMGPKHQTTLDWMRGPTIGGEAPYCRTPTSYSPSRTPSQSGTPVTRTPKDSSPLRSHPATPPKVQSLGGSRKQSAEILDNADGIPEGSIAPTPATSPERMSSGKHVHMEHVAGQNGDADVDSLIDKTEDMSLHDVTDASLGKTGAWRDNVARSSEGLVEHMSSAKGTTMTGVLKDNESVHGHLKFHHHALW